MKTQEKNKLLTLRNYYIFLLIFYSVGIIGHAIAEVRPLFMTLTPYLTITVFLLAIYISETNKKLAYWMFAAGTGTWLIESIGVITGVIFGEYIYGEVLGPKLLNAPLLISINWIIIALGTYTISKRIIKDSSPFVNSLLAAFIAVIFDYVMEPVAIRLGYWGWEKIVPPIENYIAWFIITFILVYSLQLYSRTKYVNLPKSNIWGMLLMVQFCFFLLLNLYFSIFN